MRRDRVYVWLVEHTRTVDRVLALLLFLVSWAPVAGMGVAVLAVSLLLVVPLAWRRSSPVATVGLVFAAAFGQWLRALSDDRLTLLPADVAVLAALYAVAAYGPRWASRAALGFAVLGAALLAVAVATHERIDEAEAAVSVFAASAALALAAWALGDLRRIRRAHVVQLEERAERLEREREQQAQLAAATERARIARELHDVVAHSLSVVVAQADGGRYAAARSPAAAEQALETIAATGRTALTDMRRLLGVLRDDSTGGTAPQPGVGDLEALVTGVRGSGLPVALQQTGRPHELEPGLALAAYRIVQEALTNVLKHAGPDTPTTVIVAWGETALDVTVCDTGSGRPGVPRQLGPQQDTAGQDRAGHGLVGMRERAGLYGGDLLVGPQVEGGYVVRARLPYGPPP